MDKLTQLKGEFSKAFIEAVSYKSVEACAKLVLSYDEREILFGKSSSGISKADYNEALTKQCKAFFAKSRSRKSQ